MYLYFGWKGPYISGGWHLPSVYATQWTRTNAFLTLFPVNSKQFQSTPTVHWLSRQLLLRDCLGTSWFVGCGNCLILHHFHTHRQTHAHIPSFPSLFKLCLSRLMSFLTFAILILSALPRQRGVNKWMAVWVFSCYLGSNHNTALAQQLAPKRKPILLPHMHQHVL